MWFNKRAPLPEKWNIHHLLCHPLKQWPEQIPLWLWTHLGRCRRDGMQCWLNPRPSYPLLHQPARIQLKLIGRNLNTKDQLTNYLEKIGYFSNPPKKSCSNFFWVAQDLVLVQLILIMQKITKKSLFGHFLGYPPKMHYSALQCSAMYWSANAWIIHSRWVK